MMSLLSSDRPEHRVTAAVTAVAVVSSMPAFLVGALASYIREPLDAGPGTIGAAVALFFATSAVFSVAAGRRAQRMGVRRALLVSVLWTVLSLLTIAVAPLTRWWLFVSLVGGGVGHGTGHPAGSLALFGDGVADEWRPLRFGIKQAAIPMASLLAGVSVPLIASTVGWRWAFAVAAGAAALLLVGLRAATIVGHAPSVKSRALTGRPNQALRTMAVAAALGAGAATSLPSFFTSSAVESGFSAAAAGWLLASGSVVGIFARLMVGWRAGADGRRALRTVSLMLILGGLGFVLIAQPATSLLLLGTLLAFSLGWGWTGLFNYAVVEIHPGHSGRASGVGQAGASAGAALGPLSFGIVASISSFRAAWLATAAAAITAGLAMLMARSWTTLGESS